MKSIGFGTAVHKAASDEDNFQWGIPLTAKTFHGQIIAHLRKYINAQKSLPSSRKTKTRKPFGLRVWRRRWDSNPRAIAGKLISSNTAPGAAQAGEGQSWSVCPQILGGGAGYLAKEFREIIVGTKQFCPRHIPHICSLFRKNARKKGDKAGGGKREKHLKNIPGQEPDSKEISE